MNKDELKFIDKLFKELYQSPEVLNHSTGNKTDKYKNIALYMQNLEDMHTRVSLKENRIRILKQMYYDRYVIKMENIPDSYYRNQEKMALERGFGHVKVNEDEKIELQKEVIENQKRSLDIWLDYFLSEDSRFYPFWAKYWAFQGMLKLGSYDKSKGIFNKRTKETIAPFADLNQEALSLSIDLIIKMVGKDNIEDTELKAIVETGSFQKIYPYVLTKVLSNNENIIKRNEGKWIKYNQGTDYMPLVNSLKGYNTGWCTAAEATAKSQLANGDFYVYYTLDEKNEYKVPRIAIRMENGNIGEIRGIAKNQNIESDMEEVVKEKIKDFPDKDKYYKKVRDMETLTKIYHKHQNKEELTKEELRFLYEIDYNIAGFGNLKDPRIREIITERNNQKEDLARIFNCGESQIAMSKEEITEKTVYYYWNLYLSNLWSAEGLTLPHNIGGDLYLSSLKSAEGLKLPQSIGGDLYLNSLKNAEGLILPQSIGRDLYLSSLESAECLILSQSIGGDLYLSSIRSAEGLTLPHNIGGDLYLSSLESAEGLVLPQSIGGGLYLRDLESAEGLVLPQSIDGDLYLDSLESAEGLVFPDNLTYTIHMKDFDITSDNVDEYRNKKSK